MTMQVRTARPGDRLAVDVLIQSALWSMPVIWNWEDYLENDSFVVVEQAGQLLGALFAWADDSPVAWVRLAAVDGRLGIEGWLKLVLPTVLDSLRRRGVRHLAWMDYRDWVGPHLGAWGFVPLTDVVTLVKYDRALPRASVPATEVHPARERHIPALIAVDRAAFEPYWWNSMETYRRRMMASSHFVFAELDGRVVGFAEGDRHWPRAHINRLAVHPSWQTRGIGKLLLNHISRALWRAGAMQITVNTQADNLGSLRLYGRRGFELVGDRVTAWELALQ
jgi:ribosomal protein S18 acetylase RimI-like enzyme